MSYGEPGKNTFTVPGVGGILSPVVDENTGVTQIYRQDAFLQFKSLGTYNPSTKSFTADENANLTDAEKTAFSQTSNLNTISKKGQEATEKGVIAAGGTSEQATAKSSSLFSPNAANKPESPPAEGSETLTADQEKDIGTTAKDTRKAFSQDLYYPLTLKKEKQDVLKIDMVEYRPTPLSTSSASGFGSKSEQKVIGTVHLPIPAGILDSNGVSWQSDEINPLQAAGVNFATSAVTGGGAAAAKTAEGIVNTAGQQTDALKTTLAAKIAETVTGTSNILSRTKGVITNPNMELIFNGPQLRQFAFTFKLSSRSSKESEMIRSIIRFFKQGMAVQRSASNLFLKAPNTFKLTYKHQNEDHKYLNKFKECALTNFSVDYTPEGQYATFTDGAMVSYQITLQFQELEPVFNDDYGNSGNEFPDPDIGY
jgi:hypothetical protein